MRAFLLLLAIVLVLSLIGWISFSKGPDRSSINIETDRVRADADRAVQSGAELLHKAGEKLENHPEPAKEQAPPVETGPAPVVR